MDTGGVSSSTEVVVSLLRNASSQQQPELIKPAEQQLAEWEQRPFFYYTLLQIYGNMALEDNVRWLAVIYFKNGIDKLWRNVGEHKLSDEEKERIREQLVLVCTEMERAPQLALQLAVCTGKVARQDCPALWPELLPRLLQLVTGSVSVAAAGDAAIQVRERALLTLHHVVKQIASRRLIHFKRKFWDISVQLFPDIHELFKNEVQLFLSTNDINGDIFVIGKGLQRAHLCLKVLRKMAIYGFKTPTEFHTVREFYSNICEQIKVMVMFRKQHEGDDLKTLAEKYTSLLMKCLMELLEHYPFCFLNYMRSALGMAITFAFTDDGVKVIYEKFTVQCLNMVKCIMDCPEYQTSKAFVDIKTKEAVEAQAIKTEFLTSTVLEQICHRLITHYFILSREDLEMWETDPEGYCTEVEGGDSWKFSLRPATELLFKKMFHVYRDAFQPVLLSLVTDAVKMTDPANLQGILSKDAVYNAFGLTSFELVDEVDFDNWFTSYLVNELKITDSNYRILRRRVIWLIGQWTDVRFDSENRPLLYEACIHLLSNDADFVVRYYTAITLKTAIDDFNFNRTTFLPYLNPIFSLLFNLLKEAKECDVKMQILNVMSIMIEVVGSQVRESATPLIQFLPNLWEESQQHNLLRCAILNTLSHLVTGMGTDSVSLHGFLVEVLHISTDTTQSSHVYLLEDGLQLWECVLENTPTAPEGVAAGAAVPAMYAPLLQLYTNILPIMDSSTEQLKECTQITILYIMLCPRHFLQKYGRELLDILGGQVSDLKESALVLVLRIIETIIRTCLVDGVLLVRAVLAKVVTNLILRQEAQYPSIVSSHLSLLSRVLLVDYDSFHWIVQELGKLCSEDEEAVLTQLLRVWCSRMSVVSPDERRKLAALGLCRLVAVWHPAVAAVWGRAVEAIVEVIHDVTNEDNNQDKLVMSESDYGPYTTDDSAGVPSADLSYQAALSEDDDCQRDAGSSCSTLDPDCEHNRRRHLLARADPVHTVSLRAFLGKALMQFQSVAPQDAVCQLMTNVNADAKLVIQEITANVS